VVSTPQRNTEEIPAARVWIIGLTVNLAVMVTAALHNYIEAYIKQRMQRIFNFASEVNANASEKVPR
jgi:hypothetical protein